MAGKGARRVCRTPESGDDGRKQKVGGLSPVTMNERTSANFRAQSRLTYYINDGYDYDEYTPIKYTLIGRVPERPLGTLEGQARR